MKLTFLEDQDLRNTAPISECVYCGSTKGLTREHIVPRGMKGTITLPKGSCNDCADITKGIETSCMRKTLIDVRVKHSLHRHPKERPDSFPVHFTDWSGKESTRRVPAQDLPTVFIMPIYEYPGILLEKEPEDTSLGILYASKDEDAFRRLLALPGVKSVTVESGGIDIGLFARWIAKISYCYAVARLNLDTVKNSPLRGIIRDGAKNCSYLVGGFNDLQLPSHSFKLEPPEDTIFRLHLAEAESRSGKVYFAVYVRLLPFLGAPSYLTVVCEKPQKSVAGVR
jgi:hypothetical protein